MINFGKCRYRTLAATAAGALFNSDRRRNTANGIHIRARCGLHKLSRVGIERLKITPLAFTKHNIKGHRTFAAATDTGNHGELITRDGDIDVFQIVLTGVVYLNHIVRHCHLGTFVTGEGLGYLAKGLAIIFQGISRMAIEFTAELIR